MNLQDPGREPDSARARAAGGSAAVLDEGAGYRLHVVGADPAALAALAVARGRGGEVLVADGAGEASAEWRTYDGEEAGA